MRTIRWVGSLALILGVLGLAFAAVLVLIYILVVGWFQSFKTPIVIMAVIPISLVGILPGHAILGAFFTATSMIGFIALAGIIVRNSILLVDFVNLELAAGEPLEEAVVKAGAVRFRPIVLTALALVAGGARPLRRFVPRSKNSPSSTNVAAGHTQARSFGPPLPVRASVRLIWIRRYDLVSSST